MWRVRLRRALSLVDLIVLLKPWRRTPLTVGVTPRAAHIIAVVVARIHLWGEGGRRLGSGWVRLLTNLHDFDALNPPKWHMPNAAVCRRGRGMAHRNTCRGQGQAGMRACTPLNCRACSEACYLRGPSAECQYVAAGYPIGICTAAVSKSILG
jgi:hypothetical protein